MVSNVRKDIIENVYPDNEDIPRPKTVYIHGNAAAYGYTLGNHISFNVIPVNGSRVQEMKTAGISVVEIS